MVDEYEGKMGMSSVKWESDFVLFKLKCDVFVCVMVYVLYGMFVVLWFVCVWVFDVGMMVIDKGLCVMGLCLFMKGWCGWKFGEFELI